MRKLHAKRPLPNLKKKLIFLSVFFVITATGIFLQSDPGRQFLNTIEKAGLFFSSKTQLMVQNASITGHFYTHKDDIINAVNLTKGDNIFKIDLDEALTNIQELPWIKEVSIQRVLPDSLHIQLIEKTPLVSWQNNHKYLPIDTSGKPINDENTILSHLILVVGADAPQHSPDLIKQLQTFPKIMQRVKSAVRIGGRRWNLILDDINTGTQIYLPDTDIYLALQRLNKLQEESRLLDKDLEKIDVRFSDRLIVREKSIQKKKGGK